MTTARLMIPQHAPVRARAVRVTRVGGVAARSSPRRRPTLRRTPAAAAQGPLDQAEGRARVHGHWGGTGRIAAAAVTMAASCGILCSGAASAQALSFPGQYDEPVQPFTAYGTLFKKLVIEDLDDEGHILRRRKGVTTVACVSTVPQAEETPQFQGLPTGLKVTAFGDQTCRRGEGAEPPEACAPACTAACRTSVDSFAMRQMALLGYEVPENATARVTKSCVRQCNMSCTRPGKSFSFVVTSRR